MHPLSYDIKMINFCLKHIFKIYNFKAINTFEPKAQKCVVKVNFINFKFFSSFNDQY